MDRNFARAVAVVFGLIAAAAPAHCADFAPAPAAPPAFNWTGFYFGLNAGYGWGKQNPYDAISNRFDSASLNLEGALVGGTAGAQIQVAHVVLGLETDLAWAGIQGSGSFSPSVFGAPTDIGVNATAHINWDLTARARVGYAVDNWLPYVTAGVAVLGSNTDLTSFRGVPCGTFGVIAAAPGEFACSGSKTRLGGTVGAGLEYGFTPSLSAKLEYRYTAAASLEVSHVNEVRAGLNYRFGGF